MIFAELVHRCYKWCNVACCAVLCCSQIDVFSGSHHDKGCHDSHHSYCMSGMPSCLCHMQAFDFETGLPKRAVKMLSWPLMNQLSRPFWDHLGRAALESFVPTKTTEGLMVMFDRSAGVPLACLWGMPSKSLMSDLCVHVCSCVCV